MKLVVAAIYTNYRTEIVDEGADMDQADEYISGPKCGKCILRFVRV